MSEILTFSKIMMDPLAPNAELIQIREVLDRHIAE